MWALSDFSEDKATLLISEGPDIHARDERGDTPLPRVTKDWFISLAKILIIRGAGVIARNKNGETPILIATRNRDEDSRRLLVEYGAH